MWAAVGATATLGTKINVGTVIAAVVMIILGSIAVPWGFFALTLRVDRMRVAKNETRVFNPPGTAIPPKFS